MENKYPLTEEEQKIYKRLLEENKDDPYNVRMIKNKAMEKPENRNWEELEWVLNL